jgi:hypothetical protein
MKSAASTATTYKVALQQALENEIDNQALDELDGFLFESADTAPERTAEFCLVHLELFRLHQRTDAEGSTHVTLSKCRIKSRQARQMLEEMAKAIDFFIENRLEADGAALCTNASHALAKGILTLDEGIRVISQCTRFYAAFGRHSDCVRSLCGTMVPYR